MADPYEIKQDFMGQAGRPLQLPLSFRDITQFLIGQKEEYDMKCLILHQCAQFDRI